MHLDISVGDVSAIFACPTHSMHANPDCGWPFIELGVASIHFARVEAGPRATASLSLQNHTAWEVCVYVCISVCIWLYASVYVSMYMRTCMRMCTSMYAVCTLSSVTGMPMKNENIRSIPNS
jgi:hypothetical protein